MVCEREWILNQDIDNSSRGVLRIEVAFSLPTQRVIWVLKQIIAGQSKPQQNAHVERFNHKVCYE